MMEARRAATVPLTVVAGAVLVCMADQQTGHRTPLEPHAAVPSAMTS